MITVQLQTHNLYICVFSPGKIPFKCASSEINYWGKRRKRDLCLASSAQNSSNSVERKRKVVEHICLLKAKEDLSDEEEKDMLDYLYTSQYHMGGVVAISLGRISDKNPENYTHGVYMRFQRKEDLAKFYENPLYLRVIKEHVTPHCHDLMYVDFEGEVEDDVYAIFRKGEEFNYGVEFVLLIKFLDNALDGPAQDALASLSNLAAEFPSLIVQCTQVVDSSSTSNQGSTETVSLCTGVRLRTIDPPDPALEAGLHRAVDVDVERKIIPMEY